MATHQHALDRITAIYEFFRSFEGEHAKEMRVLGDLNVYESSIDIVVTDDMINNLTCVSLCITVYTQIYWRCKAS